MTAVLKLLSGTVGVAAVIYAIDWMNAAADVMVQAQQMAGR